MIRTNRLRNQIMLWTTVLTVSLGSETLAAQLFTMDAASFRQRGGLIYQEIYFMIQRDRLEFLQTTDGFEAQYQISVELYTNDSLLTTTSWEMVDRALRLEDIKPAQKIPDLVVYNLPPGEYLVRGIVIDLNQNKTYERELKLDLVAFSDENLALSDIVLATKLKKGEEGSKFYKNGFLVIPNPERIYGTSLPMLYYYSEMYNLMQGDGEYVVERVLLDDSRKEVNRLPTKAKKKVGTSVVELDGFSVASLTSGTYYLRLVARDTDTQSVDTAETKFFVYRPEDFISPVAGSDIKGEDPLEYEINNFTVEELEEASEEVKYFVTDNEWRMIEGLNDDGRREFLIRFYRERDPNPATVVNEFWKMLQTRKDYADKKFGIWDTPGWKTNRGRVYMLYGEPDDIEYHTHDPATRAYQVWYYDSLEGGVSFIFVDRNNFGDYRLVHSTKQGELYRPNWFEQEALVQRQ